MLKTALIFGNDMVLQRDKQIPVWGTAEPGTEVTVSLQGRSATTRTGEGGSWKLLLDPLQTSFAETMTVTDGKETLTYTGVQIGEVWLAGGQSNMEFHMRYDADLAEELPHCQNDAIRFFDYPEVSYPGQIDEADYSREYGFWRRCDPEDLERFSAVGYYFAKKLQEQLSVPVGIIGCNWGGSPACAWMDEKHIKSGGGQDFLDEYNQAVDKLDLAAYDAQFRANPGNFHTDLLADPISDLFMFGATMEEIGAKLAEMGVDPAAMANYAPVVGPKYERRPSGLYESMLRPLAPYALRGFLYYQGETDGDTHPECYRTLFPALIANWRELWGEELPFLFTQIAPLEQWMACVGEPYVAIREAQQHTADTVPGTGMAGTADVGMRWDIHPKKKQPVGHRLALLAEKKVYGQQVLCDAPRLRGATAENGRLTLCFDHAGDELELRDRLPDGTAVEKTKLGGLQVLQNGAEMDVTRLTAEARGDTVVLSGEEIRGDGAFTVKLAKTGWYAVNLTNSAGIPAVPGELNG